MPIARSRGRACPTPWSCMRGPDASNRLAEIVCCARGVSGHCEKLGPPSLQRAQELGFGAWQL
eukprot:11837665-Alexandrium_andersonii.AAC.1